MKHVGAVQYSFLGVEGRAAGYRTVYYEILGKLYKQNPSLLSRLENILVEHIVLKRKPPRVEKQFSQTRSEVFRSQRAVQFKQGWWINTQFTREALIRIMAVVCQAANIPFGRKSGLWIEGMEEFQVGLLIYNLDALRRAEPKSGLTPEASNKKRTTNRGRVKYSFMGVEGVAAGYRTVYYLVLDKLTENDTSVLERTENIVVEHLVSKRKPIIKVKQFSRNREEVHWHERAKPFKGGWWINSQWGREGFIKILTVLCLAANIPLGKKSGLWIEGMEKFHTGWLPYDISSLDKPK